MSDPAVLWANLSATHRNVLRRIDKVYSTSFIADAMSMHHNRLRAFLYRLEMDGLVIRAPGDLGHYWSRTPLGDAAVTPIVTIPHYGTIGVKDGAWLVCRLSRRGVT